MDDNSDTTKMTVVTQGHSNGFNMSFINSDGNSGCKVQSERLNTEYTPVVTTFFLSFSFLSFFFFLTSPLSCLWARQLYRIENLNFPGHAVTAGVLGDISVSSIDNNSY